MYSKLGLKITNEQFDLRIKDAPFLRVDEYVNSKTSIRFKCKKCKRVFKKKPKEFNKLKCKCSEKEDVYKKFLETKEIILNDDYYNVRRKLLHKCLKCNNAFLSSPKSITNAVHGCPYCAGTKISINDYNNRLPSNIKALEDYTNSYTKIKHLCTDCDNTWITKPNYILHMGCGCPFCSASKGEKEISAILKSLGIDFIPEKSIEINNKYYFYDFYIPELKLAIEYDGIQHFEPVDYFGGEEQFKIVQTNDLIKSEWSLKNNIQLLRIPYYEDNIDGVIINTIFN